jgi:glucose-6-phosphate 1-dehydrogenase
MPRRLDSMVPHEPFGRTSDARDLAPTILVVFGATGDLMGRKIVPSLYYLFSRGLLAEKTCIVGFSRRDWDDARFAEHVRGLLAQKRPDAPAESVEEFLRLFTYLEGDFTQAEAYAGLSAYLKAIEGPWGVCANKLYYLAVPPAGYLGILENLASSGLTEPCDDLTGWTRVLIEKPFGVDEESSKALDARVRELFKPEQAYFIDHYLAKEMLQGIMNFRFTNNLFESAWNREAIERIEVSLLESLDVGTRGGSFDKMGALRDVGQNHLLEMLALITMEQPASTSPTDVRDARAIAMEQLLRPMTPGEVAVHTYRAQYDGYLNANGVAADSTSETYYRLETQLRGARWAGVPVMMESGKAHGVANKRIVVHFRHPQPCLCQPGHHYANRIVFTLEPTESIQIVFYAKRPGFSEEVEERTFSFFLYEKAEKTQYVEEYARLLHDAFRGDQTLYVSSREIMAGWRFVDPISQAWETGSVPLESYEPGGADVSERARDSIAHRARQSPRSVGIVGLGKMGANLARNFMSHGWRVVGHNRTPAVAERMAAEGLVPAATLADLVAELPAPRVVWLLVPAGDAVEEMIFGSMRDGEFVSGLADLLEYGDTVIDAGNSYFGDALTRAQRLEFSGVRFMDCGTSGGPDGARHGACLMLGGDRSDFERLEPMFADVAVPGGYAHFPGAGAGHFVKMVHNGIEYGMMQAVAEGFALMHESPYGLDLSKVADIYQHGSVVESRLVGWLGGAYEELGDDLEAASGCVGRTGEGEWTVMAAEEAGVEAPVISASVRFREESQDEPSYTGQILTALRDAFGGHGLDGREK